MGLLGDFFRGCDMVSTQRQFDERCRRMTRAIKAGQEWAEADEHAARALGKKLGIRAENKR